MLKHLANAVSEILRLLAAWFVVWFVISCLVRGLVSDPATQLAGPLADQVTRQQFSTEFGLDQPLPRQAFQRAARMLGGNWGISWRTRLPVRSVVMPSAWLSISTALLATAAALTLATVLILIAPGQRALPWSRGLIAVSFALASIPAFVLALWVTYSSIPQWLGLPSHGFRTTGVAQWRSLVLPSLCLSLPGLGFAIPRLRVAAEEIVASPWYRNALALGGQPRGVLARQGGPLLLVATGDAFAQVIISSVTGAVAVEYVFSLPGLGTVLVDAVELGDAPVILGVVAVTTMLTFSALAVRALARMALPAGWRATGIAD